MSPPAGDQDAAVLEIGGHRVRITSPERVLFPHVGFTKGDLLAYVAAVAPVMLPHVTGRPISLRRFPEGVSGSTWYQTRCGKHPAWVSTCTLTVPRGEPQDYCVIHDAAGLLWAANLSAIELHPLLMRAADPARPTAVVFDLDPGEPAGLLEAGRVALLLRSMLDVVGLRTFVKVSGSKGVHVVVPLNSPTTFYATKAFARDVAAALRRSEPDLVVDRQRLEIRTGRVLVDWLQNDRSRSTVAPYSLRAGDIPTVSQPIGWEDLQRAVMERDERPLWFGPARTAELVASAPDPWSAVPSLRQTLPGGWR